MPDEQPPTTRTPEQRDGVIELGSRIRLRDSEGEHEHTIVARLTTSAPLTCISVASPVGRALLGRRTGEQVEVHTPDGIRALTIVAVAPARVMPPWSGPSR